MVTKNIFFKKVIALSLLSLCFVSISQASTLKCANYFLLGNKKRIVEFESGIRPSDHIPDAKFIVDTDNAFIKVTLKHEDRDNEILVESYDILSVDAWSSAELVVHQNGKEKYFLLFDRRNPRMKIIFRKHPTYVESSFNTSKCQIIK